MPEERATGLLERKPAGYLVGNGSFYLFPGITGAMFYDDNIYAATLNKIGDLAFLIKPEFLLRSNWDRHQFEAAAFLEQRLYTKYDTENQTNYGAAAAGTMEINSDTQLKGRARYAHGHDERGALDATQIPIDEPIPYDQVEAAISLNKRFGRWWTSVGGADQYVTYEDASVNGVRVDQSYRTGNIGVVSGRVGYVAAPYTSVFMEVAGNKRDFEVDYFDSTGYRVVGGMLFEPGPDQRLRGEIFVGYMNQNFEGFTLETVSTGTYGMSLGYLITPEVTLALEGRREARESGVNGGLSVVSSSLEARLDWLFAPKWLFTAGVNYSVDDFYGFRRFDYYFRPQAGLKYLISPSVTAGLDYRYLDYESTDDTQAGFYRNVYMFSLNARF